jgi:hypothetical protein
MCGGRYFGLKLHHHRTSLLSRLWMHYALFLALIGTAVMLYVGTHLQFRSRGMQQATSVLSLGTRSDGETSSLQ